MRPVPVPGENGGFTLIEVIAALVVFSMGVLMVLGLTGSLNRRLENAGLRSKVAVEVQKRLDSLQLIPYDSFRVGTVSDTVLIQGRVFDTRLRVLQSTPLVREVEVTVEGADGTGPVITSSLFVLRSW